MSDIPFNNRYKKLGQQFFTPTDPAPVSDPQLIAFNDSLARDLDISFEAWTEDYKAAIFSGNKLPEGAEPIALVYAGHQFGQYSPRLGDGRAVLLGEVDGSGEFSSPASYGIQLKGSGQTEYSRRGDGLSALGPVLREYLVSEAMQKLGVPTTRALAATTTGDRVVRETMIPGGVFTRVASSYIRVGTFQYFAASRDKDSVRDLADFVIKNNYPELDGAQNKYQKLLDAVIDRQARLIAKWMQLGFIHGVMNTDNMSIAGETIDYGPCAFMDAFSIKKVFSYIDQQGRYAYENQPTIGLWNLTRFAETLLPLFSKDIEKAIPIAEEYLNTFNPCYNEYWLKGMGQKLGLADASPKDAALIQDLLSLMELEQADFTLTFRYLSQLLMPSEEGKAIPSDSFYSSTKFLEWVEVWKKRLEEEAKGIQEINAIMLKVNPLYIPRNHQIEAAIREGEDMDRFEHFHELHQVLQSPYEHQKGKDSFILAPEPAEEVHQTFCGT